jgi:SAM-dependent MidA family methyltransferase
MELHVGWNDAQGFAELESPCRNNELFEYLQAGGIKLRDGQTAEINLEAPEWVRRRLEQLEAGAGMLLTIDYGDIAKELFAEHRMNGTLICYRRHVAVDEPYRNAGEQDMTAHVDFSACLRAGEHAGASRAKLMTQREFLVEAGILGLLQEHRSPDPFGQEARSNRAIRQLLLSDQMSELFKVLIQYR